MSSVINDSKQEDLFVDVFGMEAESQALDQVKEKAESLTVLPHPEATRLAEMVFGTWLHYDKRDEVVPPPASPMTPCASNPDLFYQDWPEPDEYEDGEEDVQYQTEVMIQQANVFQAKSLCNGSAERPACPFRELCLASAVVQESNSVNEHYGVWGGQGEGSRQRIARKFLQLRRDYVKYRMTDDEADALLELSAH